MTDKTSTDTPDPAWLTDPIALAAVIRDNRDDPETIDQIRAILVAEHGHEGSWSICDAAKYLVDATDELNDAITAILDRLPHAERALARLAERHPAYDSPAGDDIGDHLAAVAQRLRAAAALHQTLTGPTVITRTEYVTTRLTAAEELARAARLQTPGYGGLTTAKGEPS